mmetsp:Transcript_23399/g.55991  ORF Transcript_23399/g.55991 Transcript_23399/m.55991 type:complete len:235 (+) Transcript_23399:201-905(+)
MGEQGAAQGVRANEGGGGAAGPPQDREGAQALLHPGRRRRGPRVLAPARGRGPKRDRGLLEGGAPAARLRSPIHAPRGQARSLEDLGPLRLLPGEHVRPDGDRARDLPAQAHELPLPRVRLQGRPLLVPGPPAPMGRARHGLPLRALGHHARALPGAGVHAGRRPHLLHPRPDRGRDPGRARPDGGAPRHLWLHRVRGEPQHEAGEERRGGGDLGQGRGRPSGGARREGLGLRP